MRIGTYRNFGTALAFSAALVLVPSLLQGANPIPRTLEEQVRHQLAMLPYLNVFEDLAFRVDHGTVTLTGKVTQPIRKSAAESALKNIPGVGQVNNQIEVLPLSRFDDQLRARTYFAIYGFGPLERYGLGTQPSIRILVENGRVTLAGMVISEMDRRLAFLRANSVAGAFEVTNQLTVER